MSQERIFTPEELAVLGKLTLPLLEQSINAGDKERSLKLSRRMYREFLSIHDLYRDWITSLLSFVGRRYGDQVLHEALKESCAAWLKPVSEKYQKEPGLRRRVEMLVTALRGHLQGLSLREDDEKVTIVMDTCGSGGRLVSEGAYEAPRSFLKVKKAQPMTFNRTDFPVYCAHCFFENILPTEYAGEQLFVVEPSKELGVIPCEIHFYKHRK